MYKDSIRKDEKEIDYSVIKQIREHAKKYDSASDKKDFLRNVCAYEQKIILLESKDPYDVITYLYELDLESTRLVLSELNFDEISKALELFTAEDKKSFYSNFPELSLVNEFIVCDKNSSAYIKQLPFDRKVELMDSSNTSTVLASSKVYESMSADEKIIAVKSMDSVNAINALNKTTEYQNDQSSEKTNMLEQETKDSKKSEKMEECLKEEITKEQDNKLKTPEEIDFNNKINEFLKANIKQYIESDKRFEEINVNVEDLYSMLPPELKELVEKDFNMEREKELKEEQKEPDFKENLLKSSYEQPELNDCSVTNELDVEILEKYSIIGNGENKVNIVKNIGIYEAFGKAKMDCEQAVIAKSKQVVRSQHLENGSPAKTR